MTSAFLCKSKSNNCMKLVEGARRTDLPDALECLRQLREQIPPTADDLARLPCEAQRGLVCESGTAVGAQPSRRRKKMLRKYFESRERETQTY